MVRDRRSGQDLIGCSRIRGGGCVWAPLGSYVAFLQVLHPTPIQNTPIPNCHHFHATPHKSIRKLHLKLLLLPWWNWSWHWKSPPQLHQKLQRRLSPHTWHPFTYSWGALRRCVSAGLRVAKRAHQPHMPQSVHMCAGCMWGWGWCVPPAARHSSTWMHSGITGRVTWCIKFSSLLFTITCHALVVVVS